MAVPKPPAAPAPLNANDHAIALLRACPEPLGQIALEMCKSMGIQPWHLVVGHLVKADQRAELHAPMLLPEGTVESETPITIAQGRCPSCGLTVDPGKMFCCNFCGSGRFQRDQVHHPNCPHFITPRRVLQRELGVKQPALVPPADPQARAQYERDAFERHLAESMAAETAPGSLPPPPDVAVAVQGSGAG